MVSDMKHSPTPIGHDLIASSLVCAGKLETTTDPPTSDDPIISLSVCDGYYAYKKASPF